MASTPLLDPFQIWRDAVTKLESEGNSLANKAMGTGQFSSALHQVTGLSLGMQQLLEKAIGAYLKRANLPSRADVLELSQSLQRIERRLEQLLPMSTRDDTVPRPPRTRQPAGKPTPAPRRAAAGKPAKSTVRRPAAKG